MSKEEAAAAKHRIEAILEFWFGPLKDEFDFPANKASSWFRGGEAFNETIRKAFGADVVRAQAGHLDCWAQIPRGMLALLILLDQFTRNLHKDAQAFESDAKALDLAREAVSKGYDLKLKRIERAFIYLPFEHSEDLLMQKKSMALFEKLCEGIPPATELPFRNMLDYAKQHYDIIQRFGRFPHRNEALNRASTPEELEFLKQPGSSF